MSVERWSGFASQSPAWQAGYEWAYDRGEQVNLDAFEAPEALGYDFGSAEDLDWQKGCEFAQNEREIN